jgi:hypothetical protein
MNQNYYQTSSLALAAAIQLASTSKLQYVEKLHNVHKASFVFNRTPDLDKIIELFWQKALPLDAFSYFETTRYIKSRLYEESKA